MTDQQTEAPDIAGLVERAQQELGDLMVHGGGLSGWRLIESLKTVSRALEVLQAERDEAREVAAMAELRATRQDATIARLREALTPSVETKAAYMGEFSVPLPEIDEDGNEVVRQINVPWTTIKKIMAAINTYAQYPDIGTTSTQENG